MCHKGLCFRLQLLEKTKGVLGRPLRVGEGQALKPQVSLIVDLVESRYNRLEIEMSHPRDPAVAIRKMHVEQPG